METITFRESRVKILPVALGWLAGCVPLIGIAMINISDITSGRAARSGIGPLEVCIYAVVFLLPLGCCIALVRCWWRLFHPGQLYLTARRFRLSEPGSAIDVDHTALGEARRCVRGSGKSARAVIEMPRHDGGRPLCFERGYYRASLATICDAINAARRGQMAQPEPEPDRIWMVFYGLLVLLLAAALWSEMSFFLQLL